MSEKVYKLGQEIPITEKGKIKIFQGDRLVNEFEIEFTLSQEQKRKRIIGLTSSPLVLFFIFILIVNLIAAKTSLNIPIQTEKLSSNIIRLNWQYHNLSSTFRAERQVKTIEGRWGAYSQAGNVIIENDRYMLSDENVEPNTTYRYRILTTIRPLANRLVLPYLKSKAILTTELLALPSEPTIVTLASSSDGQVVLGWQQPNGAEGFHIYRGRDQEHLGLINVPPDQFQHNNGQYIYKDHNLESNVRYWYKLEAWNRSGTSEPTSPTAVTIPSRLIVLSIEPSQGPGSGNTTVSIRGTGFIKEGLSVKIGGEYATNVAFVNPNLIKVSTPPGNGVQDVVVSIANGNFALRRGFTYTSIDISPTNLNWIIIANDIPDARQITIKNIGSGMLQINGVIPDRQWIKIIDFQPVELSSGQSRQISVRINANGLGEGQHNGMIRVSSNVGEWSVRVSVSIFYGCVVIPGRSSLTNARFLNDAEINISVDGPIYSITNKEQTIPFMRWKPSIHIIKGIGGKSENGYDLAPIEDKNINFYNDRPRKLYICYIEPRYHADGYGRCFIQVFDSKTRDPITSRYDLPKYNPLITIFKDQLTNIDVDVTGERSEKMSAFPITDRPLLSDCWP